MSTTRVCYLRGPKNVHWKGVLNKTWPFSCACRSSHSFGAKILAVMGPSIQPVNSAEKPKLDPLSKEFANCFFSPPFPVKK